MRGIATRIIDAFVDNPRAPRFWEFVVLAVVLVVAVITYFTLRASSNDGALLSPVAVALLLVANLLPAMAILVLLGRRIAKRRSEAQETGGDGRLHVRLVALFSLLAAVPTLLVAIFASALFQYGVDFWFSDRSRGMFENAANLAQTFYNQQSEEVAANTVVMADDINAFLQRYPIESPEFGDYFVQQVVFRTLNESAIIELGSDGVARTAAMIDPDGRDAGARITRETSQRLLSGEPVVVVTDAERIGAATLLDRESRTFLYNARDNVVMGSNQIERARSVLTDYNALFARSRLLQLQFNLAIYLVALLLVGLAVWAALLVADRIVRPVTDLAEAARRVASGNLAARVDVGRERDEISTLARVFNRMTEQLEVQTRELLAANEQVETRRALTEAVLSGVSSGVVSISRSGRVQILNAGAERLLDSGQKDAIGKPLAALSPELADVVTSGDNRAIVRLGSGNEERTLAVRVSSDEHGHVVTFDDITQQLTDQRRAAWSDVARRIAHEIKNPLTPIQLAAERLQRRYGKTVGKGDDTFGDLTSTIVRQVGDLRRMVDEFSSFARMPKPVFRRENLVDIVRQAAFLHEVAHPDIEFILDTPEKMDPIVCDRRQLTQALSNLVKNGVEAIERKPGEKSSEEAPETIQLSLEETRVGGDGEIKLVIKDSGVGIPEKPEALFEPYMTTRSGGTGLGLAIVKKIVEDHGGTIGFEDAQGGGAKVVIQLRRDRLESLAGGSAPDHIGDKNESEETGVKR